MVLEVNCQVCLTIVYRDQKRSYFLYWCKTKHTYLIFLQSMNQYKTLTNPISMVKCLECI